LEVEQMAVVEKSIDVDVPVRTAYDQWTQFESFPQFMEGVEQVRQIEDTKLHWVAEIAGARREWDAKITEQLPDQRVSWTSIDGARNGGTVSFQPVGSTQTRVTLQLDFEPDGLVETIGDKLGFVGRRAEGDLERFKRFIEQRGSQSGGWRGTVQGGERTQ
jgi:uncharacterized membrane protein